MPHFRCFWYIAAESRALGQQPLRCNVLDEELVLWRAEDGRAIAMLDRCLHRCARLSSGRVEGGRLHCRYHGWGYDAAGQVVHIPAEGGCPAGGRKLESPPFETCEQDGYVYVRLARPANAARDVPPFAMPHWQTPGWGRVRLVNRFDADVADCIENYIDVPHTAFVHAKLFRVSQGERIAATVIRENGMVRVVYHGERGNLGFWRYFLNPGNAPVVHEDHFYQPNITSVRYHLANGYQFIITSQSVPSQGRQTLVYTDLSYRFGWFTALARPFVRRAGQQVIDQDIDILAEQGEVVARHGRHYRYSAPDRIHRCVDEIRDAIARGEDARCLPPQTFEIEFYV
ncbi:aromatic ring-hydroxylating dioxygenase subunit alpha [Chitinimonas sp. JJ19]|uniref:aromatic ring-hydroxylating dioxygenase subunit alpha n=1 Tax=Chitinimonas sp. JJ19 TaxID=3109352 RepID=UPI002FFEE543